MRLPLLLSAVCLTATGLRAESPPDFSRDVRPILSRYCFKCHGDRRMKGGINFAPGLNKPGDPASRKRWKQALANVKAHDMPPDDFEKQPTEAERQMFIDWVGKVRYLSPKEPGAFVIRRLTKSRNSGRADHSHGPAWMLPYARTNRPGTDCSASTAASACSVV